MKKSHKWALMPLLVLLLLCLFAWRAPAGWILEQLRERTGEFAFSSARGSVWDGQADQVIWRGMRLGEIRWAFDGVDNWWPPRTRWSFSGDGHDYELAGLLRVTDGSHPGLERVQGRLPAAWVDLSATLPFVFLTGNFDIALDRLTLNDGIPVDASGAITWLGAGLTGLVRESLGDVAINIETVQKEVRINFRSLGSPDLSIEGTGALIGNDYMIRSRIEASPSHAHVIELLASSGEIQPDGSIVLELSGKLLPEET